MKFKSADVEAMRHALELARRSLASGDVPVGAVVLDPEGNLLGEGWNQREALSDPSAHAEVMALREAAVNRGHWRLDECQLIVTLEPCTMCAGAVLNSRIGRIVFGADEPKTGAVGSLWDVLRDRRIFYRIEVVAGVLAEESAELLRQFFSEHRPD